MAGEIVDVCVVRNQQLKPGDVLLEIRLPELEAELELKSRKIDLIATANKSAAQLEDQQLLTERNLVAKQTAAAQQTVASIRSLLNRSRSVRADRRCVGNCVLERGKEMDDAMTNGPNGVLTFPVQGRSPASETSIGRMPISSAGESVLKRKSPPSGSTNSGSTD